MSVRDALPAGPMTLTRMPGTGFSLSWDFYPGAWNGREWTPDLDGNGIPVTKRLVVDDLKTLMMSAMGLSAAQAAAGASALNSLIVAQAKAMS